jgi:hypothetical protein
VSGQLHGSAALTTGKSPRYPFYRRLGGPQSRSEPYGEVKIFYPTGTRTPAPPGRPARSQSLYRLSYPGSYTFTVGGKSKYRRNVTACCSEGRAKHNICPPFPSWPIPQFSYALRTYDSGRTSNRGYSHFVDKINPCVWQFKFRNDGLYAERDMLNCFPCWMLTTSRFPKLRAGISSRNPEIQPLLVTFIWGRNCQMLEWI